MIFAFFSTYDISYSPLEVGYKAKRVFDSSWIEYIGGQGLGCQARIRFGRRPAYLN
jgi:hypothetical protein